MKTVKQNKKAFVPYRFTWYNISMKIYKHTINTVNSYYAKILNNSCFFLCKKSEQQIILHQYHTINQQKRNKSLYVLNDEVLNKNELVHNMNSLDITCINCKTFFQKNIFEKQNKTNILCDKCKTKTKKNNINHDEYSVLRENHQKIVEFLMDKSDNLRAYKKANINK